MKRRILLTMLAVMMLILCSGCGMEESIVIHKNLSSKVSVKYYTTSQEEAAIEKELDGTTYEQLMKETGFTYLGKEELDGVEHNVYQLTQKMSKADSKDFFATLDSHQAVLGVDDTGEVSNELLNGEEYLGGLGLLNMSHMVLRIKYPFSVYQTNGKLLSDGYTVHYFLEDLKSGERIYAVDSKKVANIRKCTISGVKNKGCYRKPKTVKVSSEGVIISFHVNGESHSSNEYDAIEDGTYKIKVKLLSGSVKSLQFVIDKTKPTTNIKAKTYENKVRITFQDKTSGVKRATLNGKKIKSGTVVSQKGSHVLKITDRAGNVRTVKFSVK